MVGERYLQTQELQGMPRRIGLHNMPSSPASPTKETVVRLFLFLFPPTQDRLPKSPKSPWIPNKNRDPRASLLLHSYSYLFVTIDPYFPSLCRQPSRHADQQENTTGGFLAYRSSFILSYKAVITVKLLIISYFMI